MQGHWRWCRSYHATSAFWKFGLEKFRLLNYGQINSALFSMNFPARLQTPAYFYDEFSWKCSSLQWISCFMCSRSYTRKDICQLAGRFCFILVVSGFWSGDVLWSCEGKAGWSSGLNLRPLSSFPGSVLCAHCGRASPLHLVWIWWVNLSVVAQHFGDFNFHAS